MKKMVNCLTIFILFVTMIAAQQTEPKPSPVFTTPTLQALEAHSNKCAQIANRGMAACGSIAKKAQNGSSISSTKGLKTCCQRLRKSTPDCRCLLKVTSRSGASNKLVKFLETVDNNTQIANACGLKQINSNCSLASKIVDRQIKRANDLTLKTCDQSAKIVKEEICASTVEKAKKGIAIGRDIESVECCGEVGRLSSRGCLCKILDKKVSSNTTSEDTVEFFKFMKSNERILDRCGRSTFSHDCKLSKD